MDSVVGLARQYREEFECELVQLRRQAALVSEEFATKARTYQQLNELQLELAKRRNDLVQSLCDKSNLSQLDTQHLMRTFTWIGVMLIGMTVGSILGGIILAPIIGLVMSGQDAALIAYLLLPALVVYLTYWHQSNPISGDPSDQPEELQNRRDLLRRHALFSFATIEGFLTGFIFSHKSLIGFPPLAALTPLAIGVIPQIASHAIGKDRVKLIWLTIGGSLALHLALGTMLELTLPYLLLALTYEGIGFMALQLFINNATTNDEFVHIYQLGFVCTVIFSQAIIYTLFGMDGKELIEAQKGL